MAQPGPVAYSRNTASGSEAGPVADASASVPATAAEASASPVTEGAGA